MTTCPKCAGSMAEGVILDHGDYGAVSISTYQADEPRKSFWTGLKQSNEDQVAITTLRCGRCGYLESYAKGEAD
ncbi:MAG: hypothetical protein ABIP07_08440 [Sphingomicrobium sp.]